MEKHKNGSVTLTKAEFQEVNEAYQKLCDILSQMPSFLGDFCDTRAEYINIVKWEHQLAGREFDPAEFEDEDEDEQEL
jgi:hypothetical protein